MTDQVKEMEKKGWELAGCVNYNGDGVTSIYKRPVPPEDPYKPVQV